MTLGERITRRRKALGLSQEALAEAVGVSRQAVSKWELNEAQPDAAKIVLLAQALGVTTDQLLLGEEAPSPAPEGAAPPPPQRDYPKMLGNLLKRHGYKSGYFLIAEGAVMLLVAAVMFLMISGFFSAADNDDFFGVEDGSRIPQFQFDPAVSLTPEEWAIVERDLGEYIQGGGQ